MKRILFVGAGEYQYPGIVRAKELGHTSIAIDGNPHAVGLGLANESDVIDVVNKELCLDYAKRKNIDAVTTVASDVTVPTVAYIAEQLKLPGIKYATAVASTNKLIQRERSLKAGIKIPKFVALKEGESIQKALDTLSFPVVVKPVDSAGARGVTYVANAQELKNALPIAMAFTRTKTVIVEEFIKGFMISIEAWSCYNKIQIIALSRKDKPAPPYLPDLHVTFPADIPPAVEKLAKDVATRTIKAIGIDHAPIHMEAMVTPENEVIPVELAARGPGFKVFTHVLPRITGIDTLKETIALALGEKVNLKRTKDLAATILFLDTPGGVVKKISGLEEAKKMPGVDEIVLYIDVGSKTHALTCGGDRVGHVIVYGNSNKETLRIAKEAQKMVKIEVE